MLFCLCNLQKDIIVDCITHDQSQIFCSCVMCSTRIFCIQSIRSDKVCVFTSDFFCLCIHHSWKIIYRSTDTFSNRNGRIIMTLQHQGIKKVFQIILFSDWKTKAYFRLTDSICRNFDIVIALSVFKSKNAGHYFGSARVRTRRITWFLIENSSGITIHQYCWQCIKITGRLFWCKYRPTGCQ